MQEIRNCTRSESLKGYLDGALSVAAEAATHRHLESCPACRERLEQLAGDGVLWRDARQLLADTGHETQAPGADSIRGDANAANLGHSAIEDHLLEWIGATDDPTKLGRVGTFEIIGIVGSGGAGIVLKAHDMRLNRCVAIKVLQPTLAHNAAARKRFERESLAVAAITHQNVVPIHAVHSHKGLPYLVMQFVAGMSLQQRIDAVGPLQVIETVRIAAQIARALAAAHAQGVIHRDIKPGNILLESNVDRVLVTDFGLARVHDESSTNSGIVVGTPEYMSPEQCHGDVADQRSDLYSFGSVMYAMCIGSPPFRSDSLMGLLRKICTSAPRRLREVNPDVPDWLEAIIARLMHKQAGERFQTATEVAEILEAECAHLQNPIAVRTPQREWLKAPQDTNSSLALKRRFMMIAPGIAATAALLFTISLLDRTDDGKVPDSPSGEVAASESASDAPANEPQAAAPADAIGDNLPLFDSEVSRTFVVEPGGRFSLEAELGNVEIATGDERQVHVKITRQTAAADREEADRLAALHRIEFTQNNGEVNVVAKLDRELKHGKGRRRVSHILYRVTLPKQFNLKLATAGGNITLEDSLTGEVRVKTAGGHLKLANVKGPTSAETAGGKITIGDVEGPVDLRTSGGSIKAGKLFGAANVRTSGGNIEVAHVEGDITVATGGGNITLANITGSVEGNTSGGGVNVTISKQPGKDCALKTSGGNIHIRLAKGLALDIEAKTTAGKIRTPFPETAKGIKSSDKVQVTINGGGTKLFAKAGPGNITFEYLAD
jgi:serine/threonine-protein kinase